MRIEDVYDGRSAEDHLRWSVRKVVKSRRKTNPPLAWAVVRDHFALGSTSASKMCVWAGLDPDTGEEIS